MCLQVREDSLRDPKGVSAIYLRFPRGIPSISLRFQKGFLKFPSNSDSKGGSLALLFKLIKMFNGILEVSLQFL